MISCRPRGVFSCSCPNRDFSSSSSNSPRDLNPAPPTKPPPSHHKRRTDNIPLLFVLCSHDTSTPCIFSILLSLAPLPIPHSQCLRSVQRVAWAYNRIVVKPSRRRRRSSSGSGGSRQCDRQGECHDRERTMVNHSAAFGCEASGRFLLGAGETELSWLCEAARCGGDIVVVEMFETVEGFR